MNPTMTTYMELLQHHNPITPPYPRPMLVEHAAELVQLADDRGILPIQGPWRIDASIARALERGTGATPPGGWSGLASILAGADVLHVTREGFHAALTPEAFAQWTDEELHRRLCEAMTMRLVPPATAAGLLLLLGIHPAWGLKVANHVHHTLGVHVDGVDRSANDDGAARANTIHDPTLFPEAIVEAVQHGIFLTVAAIFEVVRVMEAGQAYPLESFAQMVSKACAFGHRVIKHELRGQTFTGALHPFIDHLLSPRTDGMQRALDFTMLDLVDHYLVPIGAARRFDTQTFCVWPEAIPGDARVFGGGDPERGPRPVQIAHRG